MGREQEILNGHRGAQRLAGNQRGIGNTLQQRRRNARRPLVQSDYESGGVRK